MLKIKSIYDIPYQPIDNMDTLQKSNLFHGSVGTMRIYLKSFSRTQAAF